MRTVFAILSLIGISGVIGTIVSRYVRPKATPLEMLQEVQEERDRLSVRVEKLEEREVERQRLDRERERELREIEREHQQGMRELTNYVHELRSHIVDGNPPPPPAWPEGLNR